MSRVVGLDAKKLMFGRAGTGVMLKTVLMLLAFLSALGAESGYYAVESIHASSERSKNLASMAGDHQDGTRWESEHSDEQWWMLRFKQEQSVQSLTIVWESARAKAYEVQISTDGKQWRTIHRVQDGKGPVDELQIASSEACRLLRLKMDRRLTKWGYSIFEVLVNGLPLAEDPSLKGRRQFKGADFLNSKLPAALRVEDLISKMTLDEKIAYLGGTGFIPDYKIGETQALYRLGLPPFKMTDASLGAKLTKGATLFPSTVALAASFNPELAMAYGQSVAEQCRAGGYRILLGPGVNLYRVPNCGRNFEYFGEDPVLATEMVVPFIQGVQGAGVLATVKHFVANNSEYLRKNSNSVVGEQALREIYYPPFKAAVQRAGVKAVMTAYNLVNGEWAGQHRGLIQGVLRDEWKFDGLVMTDWWAIYDTQTALQSGLNLEMPAGEVLHPEKVKKVMKAGHFSEQALDERLRQLLTPICEMGLFEDQIQREELRARWPEHRRVAEQVAREGLVLLKNEAEALPLKASSWVVLLGEPVRETPASGGGAAGFDPGEALVTYHEAISQGARRHGVKILEPLKAPVSNPKVKLSATALVFVSMLEHEYMDRPFALPNRDIDMIHRACETYEKVVVVSTLGSGMEMASWIDGVDAVVYAWHPGTYGASALAEVLFGEVSPSGKLPFSIERRPQDSHYHGRYLPEGASLKRHFQGWDVPKGTFDVNYSEGLFMGYRWYDQQSTPSLFPFGYGLTYTSWTLSDAEISWEGKGAEARLSVNCRLKNTGSRDAAQVLQLYLHDPSSKGGRPLKELKAFQRCALKAGEQKDVHVSLPVEAWSCWSVAEKSWLIKKGRYELWLGFSSRDIRIKLPVELK